MLDTVLILISLLVILWLIDIVYESFWIPPIGYLLMLLWVALAFDWSTKWMIVGLPLAVIIAVAIQYYVWRQVMLPAILVHIAPTRYKNSHTRLIGAIGVIVIVEDDLFVSIQDELWPFTPAATPGTKVYVDDVEDRVLQVHPIEENN